MEPEQLLPQRLAALGDSPATPTAPSCHLAALSLHIHRGRCAFPSCPLLFFFFLNKSDCSVVGDFYSHFPDFFLSKLPV